MERRTCPRIPLDVPCLLNLVIENAAVYPAMLTDISRGGLQLALPPEVIPTVLAMHASIALQDVSDPANELLEGATGRIAWVAHRHCGIRLDTELTLSDDNMMHIFRL